MSKQAEDRFRKVCFVRTGGPGDAGAFDRTLRLCERTGADLSIVGLVEEPPSGIVRLIESLGVALDMSGDESAQIDEFAEKARQRNIRTTAELLNGPAALEVIRKVRKDGHDMLVKTAQPSTAIRHLLFGHMDQQLVRKCPCPVWIENPSGRASHNRIIAAVDPAPFRDDPDFDPVRDHLNALILQMAIQIAQLEDAELHVVHVWHFYLEGALKVRAGLAEDAVAEVGETFRRRHEQALAALLRPFMRHISQVHLLKGIAADEIPKLVAGEDIDVMVMGTVCRTGIAGWLIGNTAETILNQIECSLVTLKPPGFVSPVSCV